MDKSWMRVDDIRDCCAHVVDSSNEKVVWGGHGEFMMVKEPCYCVVYTDETCWSSPNCIAAVVLYSRSQVKTRYAVWRPRSTNSRLVMNSRLVKSQLGL